jgi:hypothetical protein
MATEAKGSESLRTMSTEAAPMNPLNRATLPNLSKEEIARYSRHLIMPEVGMDGQRKLKAASVLLIGSGGLGSPLGLYLAAAGSAGLAWWISTWWTTAICNVKCCTARRTLAGPSCSRPRIACSMSTRSCRSTPLKRR